MAVRRVESARENIMHQKFQSFGTSLGISCFEGSESESSEGGGASDSEDFIANQAMFSGLDTRKTLRAFYNVSQPNSISSTS